MRLVWVTVKKELRSIFRDKKTVATLLLFPILIPMIIFLYADLYENQLKDDMYLIGVDYSLSQSEMEYMDSANLKSKYYSNQKEMERAYAKGEILGYIDRDWDNKYKIYTNVDSSDGMKIQSYATAYLEGYKNYLARVYLIGENVDVERTFQQIDYDVVNLEGENFLMNLMFTISFTYIVMSIVIATTNMATNATAVEKENGTLETILTFPVSSKNLILGKYIATVLMGFLASFIGLFLTIISVRVVISCFPNFSHLSYQVGGLGILSSLAIILMASLFIGGLSIMLTSFTKSYKEAQSVSSVLNILTVIPMMISVMGVTVHRWFYLVPIFNYTQGLMDIFAGKISILQILMIILSSLLYVVIILFSIIRQYQSEKVLFGR